MNKEDVIDAILQIIIVKMIPQQACDVKPDLIYRFQCNFKGMQLLEVYMHSYMYSQCQQLHAIVFM